ncbi:MAG: hypothetical protein HC812_01765 [Leptolyngbya sp. RL_3_1]|nr:hypothetical protein [Leptolyngbya sp. RL_3_1]
MAEPLPVETDRLTPSLFQQFRQRYPTGSLTSALVRVQDSAFVVRVQLNLEGKAVVTALAADAVLEIAEDRARQRAFSLLGIHAASSGQAADQAAMPQPPSLETPSPAAQIAPNPQAVPAKPHSPQASGVKTELPQTRISTRISTSLPAQPPAQPPASKAETDAETGFASLPPEEAELSAPLDLIPDPAAALLVTTAPEAATTPKAAMAESITVPQVQIASDLPMPAPIDLSDVIAQTDVELKRLAWSVADGREYLEQTYGKRSRHDLTDEELLAFLLHLESLPTPVSPELGVVE